MAVILKIGNHALGWIKNMGFEVFFISLPKTEKLVTGPPL